MKIGEVYFNKFLVKSLIGEGGSGQVFLAENIKLGNNWAIKKCFKGNITSGLLVEPNILKQLSHPAIPKIIDIEEDNEAVYIIEEYIHGMNLKDYRSDTGGINQELAVNFMIQLCDILNYLHTRKPRPIIYRDIKPQNIMCTEDYQLKLIDFGIAREYKEDSINDTMPMGTRGYAAPEIYLNSQSDVRTDIYGLGMTIYYLITGKNLSEAPYKLQPIHDQNKEISKELEQIIIKCCEFSPDKRYQNVDELLRDIIELNAEKAATYAEIDHYPAETHLDDAVNEPRLHKTLTIGIIGTTYGVGATHTAITIANSLSNKGKTAVFELNRSEAFTNLAMMIEGGKSEQKHFFRYQKIDYYYGLSYESFLMRYRDKYQIVILDCGSYDDGAGLEEFIRSDIKIVVGHAIDWKVHELLDFKEKTHQYDRFSKWLYAVPFLEGEHIKEISSHTGNKTFTIPFCPNPFGPNNQVKKSIKHIINL